MTTQDNNVKKNNVSLRGSAGRRGHGSERFKPTEKPKDIKGTFVRIAKMYLNWRKELVVAIALTVISSGISVIIPYYLGKSFDAFDIRTNGIFQEMLLSFMAIILSLYIVNWLLLTINSFIMVKISQSLVYVLREEFFDKLQRLPLSFYDKRAHGDTMSRVTNDVDNISSTIAQTTTELTSSVLMLVGSLLVMMSLNMELTLVVIISVPLVTVLTRVIAAKSKIYFSAQQKNLGQLNGLIEESISGLKMVKAFNKQRDIIENFRQANEQLYESSRQAQIWSGYMMPLINVINNLVFALLAFVGGILSITMGLSVGTIISFINYARRFSYPVSNIAGMFNTIQSALASAERIFEVLDMQEEVEDSDQALEINEPHGQVAFEQVYFSYDEHHEILKDINFEVQEGEVVALVGETGSGKTTIVNLLTRFYDPSKGRILIDGVDISDIKRASLRNYFSVVLQETSLFSGSIMDNIRYSQCGACDEDVINAAKLARAHEFISKLPDGYQTLVTGSTDSLSQGQKQLLAIARAVLSNNPILILDEATSSVDTKTEKEIQKALISLMKRRTCFLIAHRLSTIRDADRILVIHDGMIVESGTHESLMLNKGRYYEMVSSQMGLVKA